MKRILSVITLFVMSISGQASTIAIIDSGTDMLHKDIAPKAWINPVEVPHNDRDEDRNGYQDDIHGWNFAEGNSQVIDYSYLGRLTVEVRRFFNIQTNIFLGLATAEDIKWLREKIKDQKFLKKLQIYGNFMHGTHVGGIAIKNNAKAKLLAVKLIPTEVKLPGQKEMEMASKNKGLGEILLKKALSFLAVQQIVLLKEIGLYIDGHQADVANGSFGTGYKQARMIVATLGKVLIKDMTEKQLKTFSIFFLNKMIKEAKGFVMASPKTLFVFAAGNDGLNNDIYPTSPTNVKTDNVVSVAATLGRKLIAPFSNFGTKMVDLAAPGVGIESAVPGSQYLKVSGTSQAAPFVAGIAGMIKDINPLLTPLEIKKTLMGTVDLKTWLSDKVKSSGIVNRGRATRAAELSLVMGLDQAIADARKNVNDIIDNFKTSESLPISFEGFVLPLPNQFVIK